MGKSKADVGQQVLSQVADLKDKASKFFVSRDYAGALRSYEEALALLPGAAADRVDLLCNKAACYYQMKQYKEAVDECSSALTIAPSSAKALQRRARSLEQQGLYKQALADIQAVNRSDAASKESRDAERRVRDALAGRRPAGLGAASALAAPAAAPAPAAAGRNGAPAPAPAAQQQRAPVSAKASMGGETRLLHFMAGATYAELLEHVKLAFPEAGPVKVVAAAGGAGGQPLTIRSKDDISAAVAAAKPLRLELVACSEADAPKPPADEVAYIEALKAEQERRMARYIEAVKAQAEREERERERPPPQVAHTPSGAVVTVDDFLVDFAGLFRETSQLDADRHVDHHNQGWDATTRAMEPAAAADGAAALFAAAEEEFREVTGLGLLNWGTVHVCRARRVLDRAAEAGEVGAKAIAEAEEELKQAEARFQQALGFHPDFFDGLCAMASLEADRAKLRARLFVAPAGPAAAAADAADAEADGKPAGGGAAAALRAALARVKKADVDAAAAHMGQVAEWFAKATAAGEAADAKRKAEEAAAAAADAASAEPAAAAAAAADGGDDDALLATQARVLEGNALYEWSQLLAAVGGEWRAALDEAVARFRAGRCSEADVRGALKAHTRAEELDLGPDSEAEAEAGPAGAAAAAEGGAEAKAAAGGAEAAAAAAAEAAPEAKAKGLPALGGKKEGKKEGKKDGKKK
ncbi:hypothetical protein Rsub_00375 [Raphidocelis subcapitata]|uniref:Uncharacterized protein n=1 Tax=Raphidocelis subcapitata TaxID=307507 RepID=A0A2V0NK56_9CHLO|nr:hypothetical protein Rsub_00375 [Raphidocelis subcapitata]|eukprot:GBF87664.1 hypothetical protein Rsub_00375 [Raphidocelis subcapitata]